MKPPFLLLLSLRLVLFWCLSAIPSFAEVRLTAPVGYLPGAPFPVRVELRDETSALAKTVWDAEATLIADHPGVTLSTNRLTLRNGVGTALITVTGSSDFTLRAQVNGEVAARAVRNRSAEAVTTVSGTLPGAASSWRGVVQVSGHVTVPAGHTLTIEPGAHVIVNGAASGSSAVKIIVNGALASLGTELQPITITSPGEGLNWGQIAHENSAPSLYRHTFISKAGRAPGEGHTGTGPALRARNSQVTFQNSVISDLTANGATIGKIMMASGSDLTFRDSIFARARMGPEIAGTGLSCTGVYFMDMNGPDDADGIYLHDSGSRPLFLSNCVFAGGDDDAVDTLNSVVTAEDCIFRDWSNPNEDAKAVSAFHGEVILRRCLMVNCFAGVAAKSNGPLAIVRLDHCTIQVADRGVSAATKANALAGNIQIFITNSIVLAADPLHSAFGSERFSSVTFCDLGEAWTGAGNFNADPLFVDPAAGDYRLQPTSPCLNAGDPTFPPDADGTRTDIGYFSNPLLAVAARDPAPGDATNLSVITVIFTKPVNGVDAADLLLGGIPARSVNGSGPSYTFSFATPPPGPLTVTWAATHGISDTSIPPVSFDSGAEQATWEYNHIDNLSPALDQIVPLASSKVPRLTNLVVTFSELVQGVNASDLIINSTPASSVTGAGAGPYLFTFPQPPPGAVKVSWSAAHGIQDAALNLFTPPIWTVFLDPKEPDIVINEIMYHPASENSNEEYIELLNRGPSGVVLTGWSFSDGVSFTFPDVTIPAHGCLVIAADVNAFRARHPAVANVIGNWTGTLSNGRETIALVDASGEEIDSVQYADQGDWSQRRRGSLDRGQRGWAWYSEHDGRGKSLELINPRASNENGQNWSASDILGGTPGHQNSVLTYGTAPLIAQVGHSPIVPRASENVVVTATMSGFSGASVQAVLHYRLDSVTPDQFTPVAMHDDGRGGDALAGDGTFSVSLPPQTNHAVVEFYVSETDEMGRNRNWPAPALASVDGFPGGQIVNALYQVDDSQSAATQPLYRIIMTEAERLALQSIGNNAGGSANSDAQMNATFISGDADGFDLTYSVGVRNRGHGSRTDKPNNFRVNFPSDQPWKDVLAINLNAQFSWLQILGSALHLKSGVVGAYSRAVQLRVNNANLAFTGGIDRTYGSYAANEVIDADWAERHFPNDSNGNVYRAIRDRTPPEFDYRPASAYPFLHGGENKNSYTNTWFKSTNQSEDDWTDLIAMLRVIGMNGTEAFTAENVAHVIDPEQWLLHLAVMNLLGSGETGLNTGHNDDYYLYRPLQDPRFILMYYDLDQILGYNRSHSATGTIYSAAADRGAGSAIGRLLNHPDFKPIYHSTLRRLLHTSFSAPEFNSLVDLTLGEFVPANTRANLKNWMNVRREYVLGQLPPITPRLTVHATLTAAPRSPTPRTVAIFQVGGHDVTAYRYSLNGAPFTSETPIDVAISLSGLPEGTNVLSVIGRSDAGVYQSSTNATAVSWVVNASWVGLRLNEALATARQGGPDQVELFNDSDRVVDLGGLRLTDTLSDLDRFVFPPGSIAPNSYLVLDAGELGFALNAQGETLYLLDRAAAGSQVLDSVTFGTQIEGFSIGRVGENGAWALTQPTFGRTNIVQPLADVSGVRINEWLASGTSPYPDDFVELYNPALLPAAIGGSYLTDQRAGAPTRHPITSLSFIAPHGHALFTSGNGSEDLAFHLASEQGEISLLDADLGLIDSIIYGPQLPGVTMGRCPDGDALQKRLVTPTPGAPNRCPVDPLPLHAVPLVAFTNTWKYDSSGADLGSAWKDLSFDDSTWAAGPGAFGFGELLSPEPIRTPLQNRSAVTYYFRSAFNVEALADIAQLKFTYVVNDGIAFYLNGAEVGTRYNLHPAANYQTFASSSGGPLTLRTFTIPADQLLEGQNILAAEVHQSFEGTGDLAFGLALDSLVLTNAPGAITINEILARNSSFENLAGRTPGWIELYNPSSTAANVSGMTLTRDVANPAMFTLAAGTTIPGHGYLIVECDDSLPPSGSNTGFSLDADGGSVYLYNSSADGGGIRHSITYGLQAADWSIGVVPETSTNWSLTLPTPGAANRPVTVGDPTRLKVNEWLANPSTGGDWFEIYNPEVSPVSLAGLTLSDSLASPGKQRLPNLSFIGVGEFIKFNADNDPAAGSSHVAFALSASGEAVVLSDARGVVIDAISFGPQSRGVSEGRLPDGGEPRVFFPYSSSPGAANYLPLDHIVINEILTHSDSPLEDAVEVYNPSGNPVDISGWFLSDSESNARKYQVPQNTVLSAGGFHVFYENAFNGDSASEPFSLSSLAGDEIFLSEAQNGFLTGYRASARFGAARPGVSFGPIQTSQGPHFVPLSARTFGQDNPATVEIFRTGQGAFNAAPLVGPVVITEIMYNPPGVDQPFEFVELRNVGATAVTLFDPTAPARTWRLDGGIDFQFPGGLSLSPGEYIIVVGFNPVTDANSLALFRNTYGSTGRLVGPFQGALSNGGETIDLQQPGEDAAYTTVDRVDYGDENPWALITESANQSLQKRSELDYGNEPAIWRAATPTAGGPTMQEAPDLTIGYDASGSIALQFEALTGQAYRLLGTASLLSDWDVVAQFPAGAGNRIETVNITPLARAAFFRLELLNE